MNQKILLSSASPVYTYAGFDFNGNKNASVTGGYVYRGSKIAAMLGWYVFADFGVSKLAPMGSTQVYPIATTGVNPVAFGEDADGDLYPYFVPYR